MSDTIGSKKRKYDGEEVVRSNGDGGKKKRIFLNAFDSCTVGHTCPGQWRNPRDQTSKKRNLEYWTETAKTLERGKFSAFFLADTVGGFEVYKGSRAPAIKIGEEVPVLDPFTFRSIALLYTKMLLVLTMSIVD